MLINRLGQVLVREQLLSGQQFQELERASKVRRERIIRALYTSGAIEERRLLNFLSRQFRLPVADLQNFNAPADLISLLEGRFCQKHMVFPIAVRSDTLVLAVVDPTDIQCLDDVRFRTRKKIEMALVAPSVVSPLLERYYAAQMDKLVEKMTGVSQPELAGAEVVNEASNTFVGDLKENDAPIVNYVTGLMIDAIKKRASDIHVEPYENDLRVRYRIDGKLVSAANPPVQIKAAIVSRIKVMAKMRIDEKRLPQDGRVMFRLSDGRDVDFRVNTLPTIHGEKVVMRILDRSRGISAIKDLGMEADDLAKFERAIRSPWGICLVTGPTGSGKTSTLYSALKSLNTESVNISTIEEPVEYQFHGVNQVNVKDAIGLSFSESLRALLRQDPDIILLGEIRDADTAKTAMQAALTGHMVMSTIHTNDAPSTVVRMADMGAEPFLINATVQVVVAQRLVRRLCLHCRVDDVRFAADDLKRMGFPQNAIGKFQPKKGKGCSHCNGTGCHGRLAVFEVMVMTDTLRAAVTKGVGVEEFRVLARREGMRSLYQNGLRKVIHGLTSIDEVQALGFDAGEEDNAA